MGFPSVRGGFSGWSFWDSHLSEEVSGEVFFGIPTCLGRCLGRNFVGFPPVCGGFGRFWEFFGVLGAWESHDIVTSGNEERDRDVVLACCSLFVHLF